MTTTISNAESLQPQPQKQPDAEAEYTFSSAAFRKKKKKSKKFRGKKIVTKEAASSRGPANQQLSRSLSTAALANPKPSTKSRLAPSASATSLRRPVSSSIAAPPPSSGTSTANAVFSLNGSPVQTRRKLFGVARGNRDERQLDLSSVAKKPWESDIRKKHKTECGNRILRDGPSSRASPNGRSARRCRSLSTTRYRSPKLSSERNRSWSDDDSFDEEITSIDDGKDEVQKEINALDDAEKSYEKYRQFLASTRRNDNDESLSRQSVLSLKQKLGAAPALNFSYRYSAAADELIGLESNYDNSNFGDKVANEEQLTSNEQNSDPSKPDNLAAEKNKDTSFEEPVVVDNNLQDNENNFDGDSSNNQIRDTSKLDNHAAEKNKEASLEQPVVVDNNLQDNENNFDSDSVDYQKGDPSELDNLTAEKNKDTSLEQPVVDLQDNENNFDSDSSNNQKSDPSKLDDLAAEKNKETSLELPVVVDDILQDNESNVDSDSVDCQKTDPSKLDDLAAGKNKDASLEQPVVDGNDESNFDSDSVYEQKSDPSKLDNLSAETNKEASPEQPVVVDDGLQDNENDSVCDGGDDQLYMQVSSPTAESPLLSLSPEPSQCSPSLADSANSLQSTEFSTTSVTSNKEGLPLSPSQMPQQRQQHHEHELNETHATGLLSGEENRYREEEKMHSSVGDRDKADEDVSTANDDDSKKVSTANTEDEYRLARINVDTSTNLHDDNDIPGHGSDNSSDCCHQERTAVNHDDQKETPIDKNHQNEENRHCPPDNEINGITSNKNNDCEPQRSRGQNRAPISDSEDSDPIESLDTKKSNKSSCVDESSSSTNIDGCNVDVSEDESLTNDPDYPEEDRELLSLMYHIHTS